MCHAAKDCDERNGDSGSESSDDSGFTVIPGSSKSLSGVSRYRDLIQRLPVNVAKRILGKEESMAKQVRYRFVFKFAHFYFDDLQI